MRPVLFHIPLDWLGLPTVPVYGFGLMLVVAFLAAFWLARLRAVRYGIDPEQTVDLGLYAIVAGLVGARLAFLIWDYEPDPLSTSPFLDMLAIWEGGLTFQGGLIMALAVVAWYLSSKRIGAGRAMDVFAPSVALGAGIGRLGCFLNSCCWGRLSGPGDFGVVFAPDSDVSHWQQRAAHELPRWTQRLQEAGYSPENPPPDTFPLPVIPTQLYEFIALVLLAAGLVVLDRLWKRRPAGMLMVLCLGAYSFFRFFIEYARDDTPMLLAFGDFEGLKLGQWLALATISVCVPLAAVLMLRGETLDFTKGPLKPSGPPPPPSSSAAASAGKPTATVSAPKASTPGSGRPPGAEDPWSHPVAKPPPVKPDDEKTVWHDDGGRGGI